MAKSKHRAKKKKVAGNNQELIVIDENAGLIFQSTEDLYDYFKDAIQTLESEYQSLYSEKDFNENDQEKYEDRLEVVLDEPDEIWRDDKIIPELVVHHFLKHYEDESIYYVATAYVSTDDDTPTFVLLHFATKMADLFKNYQRGEMIYDRRYEQAQVGALEGDALSEGDALALGLYTAMLKVRSDKDVDPQKFKDFSEYREETIENADEIWRKNDLDGNILVSFIKEYPDHEGTKDLHYVAITQEDPSSNVHSLLFSFPTTDKTLLDRYRQGENLQADEITQESSH
jgi:hypothetical protein